VGLVLLTACGGDGSTSNEPAPPSLTIDVSDPAPGRFQYLAPKRVDAGVVEIRLTSRRRALSHREGHGQRGKGEVAAIEGPGGARRASL